MHPFYIIVNTLKMVFFVIKNLSAQRYALRFWSRFMICYRNFGVVVKSLNGRQVKNQIALRVHTIMASTMHTKTTSKIRETYPPESMARNGHILADKRM